MSLSGTERLDIWMRRIALMNARRYTRLAERYPHLDHAAVMRKYVEETYRGEFTRAHLDRYEALVRERDRAQAAEGAPGPPTRPQP